MMKSCMLVLLVALTGCAGRAQVSPQPTTQAGVPAAGSVQEPSAPAAMPMQQQPASLSISSRSPRQGGKVLFLISEQNIEGQVVAWWGESAGEVRLSVTEPVLFNALTQSGFEVIDPSGKGPLRVSDPYRRIGLGDQGAMELGRTYGADYVVLGKALAISSQQPLHVTGRNEDSNYAQRTNMRSASATLTAKLIRLSDRKVVAFVSGSGDAIHVNPVTAGKEALEQAAQQAAEALISQLQ
mgnify:CR=1 FL=1